MILAIVILVPVVMVLAVVFKTSPVNSKAAIHLPPSPPSSPTPSNNQPLLWKKLLTPTDSRPPLPPPTLPPLPSPPLLVLTILLLSLPLPLPSQGGVVEGEGEVGDGIEIITATKTAT